MATREAVMTALLAAIVGTGAFETTGRRNRGSNAIGPTQSPACFLFQDSERQERKSPMLPPKRILNISAVIINDVGQDPAAVPATLINAALEALDALFRPDNLASGRCTLGGLVESLMIDGEIVQAPGDQTGKALAVVPLQIILP